MSTRTLDHYDVLGLARDASQDDIRSAYRRLARKYHPDVSDDPDAEDRFKEVGEAFEVLGDPESREKYDRYGHDWRYVDASGAPPPPPRPPGGGGPGGRSSFSDEDLFEALFGHRGEGATFRMRGNDVEAVLDVTLEEAAAGGSRRLTLPDGTALEVKIPVGMTDGRRIRLAGQGGEGLGGGERGDLFLVANMVPHPRFRLEGRDLHLDLPVAPWEAALGAKVPVETLDGTVSVTVPKGSSTGRKLRLRGRGLPDPKGTDGDLFATVKVVVPRKLSDRERELFEALRDTSDFAPRG